jgi:hypothetical protein
MTDINNIIAFLQRLIAAIEQAPAHPYTRALVAAVPRPDPDDARSRSGQRARSCDRIGTQGRALSVLRRPLVLRLRPALSCLWPVCMPPLLHQ